MSDQWLDETGALLESVVVVALGGNLDSHTVLRKRFASAIDRLSDQWGAARVSPVFLSSPVGEILDQPGFLNLAAAWRPVIAPSPMQALHLLQQIEDAHGRERTLKGGPRTLDLDLLLLGNQRVQSPKLDLPHPRMHLRAFVLKPLQALFGDEFRWLENGPQLAEYLSSPLLRGQECRELGT